MKKSGFILIAIIVVGLSLGPLTYFSGIGGDGKELGPANETQGNQENFYVASSNFTGYVEEVEPYVYFEGIKESNNATKAKEEIASVLPEIENYSLGLELGQNGWIYSIKVPVENLSHASEVGFKLDFLLSLYYSDSVNPYKPAKVKMPDTVKGKTKEGEIINIKTSNKTVDSTLVYSEEGGDVKISCSRLLTSLNGELTENMGQCAQPKLSLYKKADKENIKDLEYIVTKDHFERVGGKTHKLNQTLNITDRKYRAIYSYNNTNKAMQVINTIDSEVKPRDGSKTITIIDENHSNLLKSMDKLNDGGLKQRSPIGKIVEVDIPEKIEVGEKQFPILRPKLNSAKLSVPMQLDKDKVKCEVTYGILYGYVFATPEVRFVGDV